MALKLCMLLSATLHSGWQQVYFLSVSLPCSTVYSLTAGKLAGTQTECLPLFIEDGNRSTLSLPTSLSLSYSTVYSLTGKMALILSIPLSTTLHSGLQQFYTLSLSLSHSTVKLQEKWHAHCVYFCLPLFTQDGNRSTLNLSLFLCLSLLQCSVQSHRM